MFLPLYSSDSSANIMKGSLKRFLDEHETSCEVMISLKITKPISDHEEPSM